MYNLIVKKNGYWAIVNKKPMTSKAADKMYDDYKRSGILHDDLSVEEIREELPF
jgi:hypothetical protein